MKILWRITKYGFSYPWLLGWAYAMNLAATAAALAIPPLMGDAIDEALSSGLRSRVVLAGVAILGAGTLRAAFGYVQIVCTDSMMSRVERDLRVEVLDKLQRLSFAFHDRQRTGDLMSRATADVDETANFMQMGLIQVTRTVVWFVAIAAIMMATNWRLGLISLAFMPLSMWLLGALSMRIEAAWARVQKDTGRMTSVLQESVAGNRLVQAFGASRHEERRFASAAATVARDEYLARRSYASFASVLDYLFVIAMGAMVWFGAREVVDGRLSEGELAMFLLYMTLLQQPMRTAGWIVNQFAVTHAAGKRLFEVLDAESPVLEASNARPVTTVRGRVRFDRVSFSYDSGAEALHDIDFEVQPGQMVALLGAPGSGKSSIVHLVPRFYDATAGRVTVDGVDVRELKLRELRRNVGIVLQDVFIFGATFRDNLAYGAEEAAPAEIEAAARVAQLHDFIDGLPDKYETWVGERGVKLSGGQRQRLAIARTILLDPATLILDDSTSSVDVETEHQIQQALAEVVKGRTTFVIAHRLSTVRNADLILVMDEGRIAERGTHHELLSKGGLYRRIHDIQLLPQEGDVILPDSLPALKGDSA